MNQYAFIEKNGREYRILSFVEKSQVKTVKNISALMMSRLDIDLEFTDIPPLSEHEIAHLLKYKLRSLYPGNPEDTVFDFTILHEKNHRYAAVFITSKHTLDNYRRVSSGKPLFLPFTIIKPLAENYGRKESIIAFYHKSWIELFIYKDNVFQSSSVLKREETFIRDFKNFQSFIPKSQEKSHMIFVCSSAEKNRLEDEILKIKSKGITFDIFLIEDLLGKITRKTQFLFKEKKQKNVFMQKASIPVLFILILIFSGLLLNKTVNTREAHFNKLNDQLVLLQEKNLKITALSNELGVLKNEIDIMKNIKPTDLFILLSELYRTLGSDTKVTYLSIEKNEFQFEGIGPDPLGLMEKFNSNDYFQNIKLLQIVPVQGNEKERFKVMGIVKIK